MYSEKLAVETNDLYRVDAQVSGDQLLVNGDILFVRSSVKREGVGWPAIFDSCDEQVSFCGFLIRCRLADSLIDPYFLTWCLRSSSYRNLIISSSGTGTITNISQKVLANLKLPLPTLPEQKRIVAQLSEQMAAVEKVRTALEAQLNEINTLPAALLRQAFAGEI